MYSVLLLEAGTSLDYVLKRLGHKTIKTTADEYTDITDKINDNELDKLVLMWHENGTTAKVSKLITNKHCHIAIYLRLFLSLTFLSQNDDTPSQSLLFLLEFVE